MFKDLRTYINIKNPLFKFTLFLTFFGFVALADLLIPTSNPTLRSEYIFKFIITFLTSGVIYYMIRYGFGIKSSNPLNFLVSTWLVFMLIHPTNSLWVFPFAVVSIALGKLLFRKNNQPVFNPAALAITLTYFATVIVSWMIPETDTLLVSWWGTDMFQNVTSTIPVVNTIVPLFFLLGFMYTTTFFKKTTYALTFLVTFMIGSFIYILINDSFDRAFSFISVTLFNATAFAALVMIPEPKTSPIFQKQYIIVGIISGLTLLFFNTQLAIYPIDPLINTILVTNLVVLYFKMQKRKPTYPFNQPSQPQTQPINQNIQNIA